MNQLILHPSTQASVDVLIKHPSHGIGLVGVPGSGKGYLALHLIGEWLSTTEPSSSPYVLILDGSKETGIESVRDMQSFLSLHVPGRSTLRRAVIIENSEQLGHEAQNALLKTLEEPPSDTVIVCTASARQLLLKTITSRLQWIEVRPVSLEQLEENMAGRYQIEQITKAYHLSAGALGLATALLAEGTDHELSGAVDTAKKLLRKSRFERLASIDSLLKSETSPALILDAMYRVLKIALQSQAESGNFSDKQLKQTTQQLLLVSDAQGSLGARVQPKLVLTTLFNAL